MRRSLAPFTTSVVPRTLTNRPGRPEPAASWAAQASVIPSRTEQPAGRPVSAAASSLSEPAGDAGAATSGRRAAAAPVSHHRPEPGS